ncbi:MAG: hypothetical protein RSC66_13815, partial [Comamonas sp.]
MQQHDGTAGFTARGAGPAPDMQMAPGGGDAGLLHWRAHAFQALQAPRKQLVWFEQSAHEVMIE